MITFILLIALIILWLLLEITLNKLFGVEKKRISETSGKRVDLWGRVIILVIFFCFLPFIITKDTTVIKWYWILNLIIFLGFQSFVEWKYLMNSKQYVTTLIFLIISVIIMFNMEIFLKIKDY